MPEITVRYFAAAEEAAGTNEERLSFEQPPTLQILRAELEGKYGAAMVRVLRSGSFLVDGTVRRDGGEIRGSVVDVLPPFAGG